MKERPIIFGGDMVRALPDGRKTQTRRIIKIDPQPVAITPHKIGAGFMVEKWKKQQREMGNFGRCDTIHCPYGVAGDRIWVRETFAQVPIREPDGGQGDKMGFIYRADGDSAFAVIPDEWEFMGKWKPSIFMPRIASRITLEITRVRVERLQDISEADAKAEGVIVPDRNPFSSGPGAWEAANPFKFTYLLLWDSLHGKGAWDKNPWGWVLEFVKL